MKSAVGFVIGMAEPRSDEGRRFDCRLALAMPASLILRKANTWLVVTRYALISPDTGFVRDFWPPA